MLISYPKTNVTSIARVLISLLVAFSYPLLGRYLLNLNIPIAIMSFFKIQSIANPGRNSAMELWRMTDKV